MSWDDADFFASFSQGGQDIFLDQVIFKSQLRDGFFVEAGADDLVEDSNTLYFEIERGWTGILVEPVLWEKRWIFEADLNLFVQGCNQTKRLVRSGLSRSQHETPFRPIHRRGDEGRDGWLENRGGRRYN